MKQTIQGLHHVTAISGAPRANVDFYAGFLGLRLVKKTVNFDDPGTYHLYYGDALGHPGTIMTFFPWSDALRGRTGSGMTSATAFAVPEGALDYWMARFADAARDFQAPRVRLGQQVLAFTDPDGLQLELVADAAAGAQAGWEDGPVPAEHAVRSFYGVTLAVDDPDPTARLLTDVFGYAPAGEEGRRLRFRAPGDAMGRVVDLLPPAQHSPSRLGTGTIHHVAFRARDDEEQAAWREAVASLGYHVTQALDRQYFRSIYFREPGGVLFEIATDPPGFTADEAPEALGTALKLPPWLEPQRARIERRLPVLA
jgi:glyoxalase family protein